FGAQPHREAEVADGRRGGDDEAIAILAEGVGQHALQLARRPGIEVVDPAIERLADGAGVDAVVGGEAETEDALADRRQLAMEKVGRRAGHRLTITPGPSGDAAGVSGHVTSTLAPTGTAAAPRPWERRSRSRRIRSSGGSGQR